MSEIYLAGSAHHAHRMAEPVDGGTPRRSRRMELEDTSPFSFATLLLEVLPAGERLPESAGPLHSSNNVEEAEALSNETGDHTPGRLQAPHDIEVPDTDLSKLDPEFRVRLGRVMQRMEEEYGHRVQVVEALRPQERQDFLYEQGRNRPGPVVTWTRASKHTLGLAADVLVDGVYENPEGYARLAQIAQEEGLRTLGPRDPGHLELAADRSAPGEGLPGYGVLAARKPVGAIEGRTASVALVSVARVAEVAEVARVASIAASAVRSVLARQSASPEVPARGHVSPDDTGGGGESQYGAESPGEEGSAFSAPSGLGVEGHPGLDSFADRLRLASSAGSVERAARLLEIRQAASLRNPSQVVLRLDDADGDPVQIRIGLRGNLVDARIGLSSEAAVERMRAQIGDLVQALSRRGLDADGLQVQLARGIAEIQELVDTPATRIPASADAGREGGSERERAHSGLLADDPRDREARDHRDSHSFHDQERKERS